VAPSPTTPLDLILTSDRLPSPSGVALKILQLTSDENASLEDLTRVLVMDPALAGQMLKYANSAQARTGHEARTINEAVVRLGMATVRRLALGFSLLASSRSGPCPSFDYNRFWSHSLATAVAAQNLAPTSSNIPGDEAFTCGLLGQIGRLCLASVHPAEYDQVLSTSDIDDEKTCRDQEQAILSVDHDRVTTALFDNWGLPEMYSRAVIAQSKPDAENTPNLALILNTARGLAEVCVAPLEARPAKVEKLVRRGARLGIEQPVLVESCEHALADWTHMGEVLDIITEDVPAIDELVARAGSGGDQEIDVPTPAPAPSTPKNEPLRVLVVDDSPLDQRLVGALIKKDGHSFRTADNGKEALKLALQWNPQLIISDWMMPELDGLDLCRALRRSQSASHVYFMLMTANDQQKDLVTALEAGADDFVPKPLDQAVLRARMRAAKRVIELQERAEHDREEIRAVAANLSLANRKLQHMALYDTLTGLPNRRYAMDRLVKEWDRAERQGDPLLVMILDIDHFKSVNDTYGHDVGDVVLQQTAQVMKDCLRSGDDICRFGGEEFLAICPDADLSVAFELGERLRDAVAKNHIENEAFQGGVTVSIGVSGHAEGVDSVAAMLKLADEALYAAKDAGRDKVCIVDLLGVG